ncbi:MAG: hypothetical protein ABW137_24745 [Mycobacterium sp.]
MLALPLMVVGYVVDLVTVPVEMPAGYVYAVSAIFLVVLSALVLTFGLLMRQGYRWARTLLTGGAAATLAYVVTNLFGIDRPTVAALVFAVSAIIGAVAIAGGMYLLHRKDAHAYFTR